MSFVNAYEPWSLYDTVLVGSNVNDQFNGAGYFTSYQALAVPPEIPFFNVRNQSVGTPYCNLDSANKLPFVFHATSIGIDFDGPVAPGYVGADSVDAGQAKSNLMFATDLAKHAGFILRVAQDEKLVQTCTLMPSGQGIDGWAVENPDYGSGTGIFGITNATSGIPEKPNRWKFPEPIQMPREVNFDGKLVFSPYAREMLRNMYGPFDCWPEAGVSASAFPLLSSIRVTLYGIREVQQRNQLHFS